MLTQAPVPSWSSLFQAFWQRPLSLDELSSIWRREGEVAGWLYILSNFFYGYSQTRKTQKHLFNLLIFATSFLFITLPP